MKMIKNDFKYDVLEHQKTRFNFWKAVCIIVVISFLIIAIAGSALIFAIRTKVPKGKSQAALAEEVIKNLTRTNSSLNSSAFP